MVKAKPYSNLGIEGVFKMKTEAVILHVERASVGFIRRIVQGF